MTVFPVSGLPPEFADRSVAIFDGGKVTGYSAWSGSGLKMPKESLCKSCHASVSEYHKHSYTDAAKKAVITCTDCHMPDVINVNSKLRGALTTHNFKFLSPENSIKYGVDIMPNSCTYRCHQDRGADKTARANWVLSAMGPAATATTTAPATTTKAPAFELLFAVGALFIATLVRRR